ncbi:hypothetical protein SSOG_05947 [Streptomyces himastatinicus ATCC 53653]|uniref:Secreted protein n=1 Tax=Streptomyces himastatinicus ATCC 53653 TaxID=457427 RepID=D9WT12_9ACTN|nr:hypothetical protein SSOG_05947 [Streptomyces himastatinicus ATCC 53653]
MLRLTMVSILSAATVLSSLMTTLEDAKRMLQVTGGGTPRIKSIPELIKNKTLVDNRFHFC